MISRQRNIHSVITHLELPFSASHFEFELASRLAWKAQVLNDKKVVAGASFITWSVSTGLKNTIFVEFVGESVNKPVKHLVVVVYAN